MRDSIFETLAEDLVKEGIIARRIDTSNKDWGNNTYAKLEDKVNSPSHYTFGEIEVIEYIKDKLTQEEFEGYVVGNVIKYTSRWKHKGGIEDLKKAEKYLSFLTKGR